MSETLIASKKEVRVYNKAQQKVRDILLKYNSVTNLEQLYKLYRSTVGQQCDKEAYNAHYAYLYYQNSRKYGHLKQKFNLFPVNDTVPQYTKSNTIS